MCDEANVQLVVSALRTTSESSSGSHCGHGKAEAIGVRERRTVATFDGLMIVDEIVKKLSERGRDLVVESE